MDLRSLWPIVRSGGMLPALITAGQTGSLSAEREDGGETSKVRS